MPEKHCNAASGTAPKLRWLMVRENMRRFAAGEKMYSVFDLARGY